MHELETDRLLLRHWRPEDRAPFAVLNAAVVANERSRAVMRRIGMHHDPDGDFDHPQVGPTHLRRHVLYRLTAADWRAASAPAPA